MFNKGNYYVLMDQSGGEGGAGSGNLGVPATGAVQTPAANTAAATSGAATGTPAVTGGATTPESVLAAAADDKHYIPEKYHVKKDDGTLDIEASSKKLGEAYGHLAKRMGTGDVPPKSPDEYTVAVPESLKGVFDPKTDPTLGEFLKEAHAAGYTQTQVDLAMNRYMELAPKLLAGDQAISAETCVAELKTQWKTDEQYKAELSKAHRAAVQFAGEDAEYLAGKYGNDPKVIRMLARMGAELGDDKALPAPGGQPASPSVHALVISEAYNNPRHPDHASVSKQVAQYYVAQAEAARKAGNSPIM